MSKDLAAWVELDRDNQEQIASLQKQLAERTAERDEARKELLDRCWRLNTRAEAAEARADALAKERDEAIGRVDYYVKVTHEAADTIAEEHKIAVGLKAERDALAKKVEGLDAALRSSPCPHPANGRPDDFTAGQCFDALECGCNCGSALEQKP